MDRSTPGGDRVLLCAVTVHVNAKTCSSCLLASDLPRARPRGLAVGRGPRGGHCFCRAAVFVASLNSVLPSWGDVAVPTEREPASCAPRPPRGPLPPALHFLPQQHLDTAAHLAQGGKERVAEGADAERVDVADALDLDQVALDAGYHGPDVAEGDAGKQEAPEQGQRDAQQCGQQAVAPVLGDGEGGIADLPHAVKAVGAHGLRNHVLEVHLQG